MSEEERTRDLIDAGKLARWMDEQGLPGAGTPLEIGFVSGGADFNHIFCTLASLLRLLTSPTYNCEGLSLWTTARGCGKRSWCLDRRCRRRRKSSSHRRRSH